MSVSTYSNADSYYSKSFAFQVRHRGHQVAPQTTVDGQYYSQYCCTCRDGLTHAWMTMSPSAVIAEVRASESEPASGEAA